MASCSSSNNNKRAAILVMTLVLMALVASSDAKASEKNCTQRPAKDPGCPSFEDCHRKCVTEGYRGGLCTSPVCICVTC
ncbi:hypothetical protein BRADI_1g01873v3 [Brachypodium distachyon]|uniref:Invertebrate defensins family profile domain-containing protein n=1 Tax=Brachypodium distachyon TaxID=15368 RepID=A0A2K2DHP2_BRADI|nr:hypothetical protein BRADI_1g01873v3 [Brachypodium distachyon]